MKSVNERIALHERIERTVKVARTYLRKASNGLYEESPPNTWYWDLLHDSLRLSREIVEKLPDDFFESSETENVLGLADIFDISGKFNLSDDTVELVAALSAALEKRREKAKRDARIAALENVAGRTPEEAEMYLAKARELRGAS